MHLGRNAPCPCGSGRKYKKCCWNKDQESPATKALAFVGSANEDETVAEFGSLAYMDSNILQHADYWLNFGQALGSAGYHEPARHAFERTLKLDPSEHGARLNLATTLGELGLLAEGIELIEGVPNGFRRRSVILANLLLALERYEDAIPL